MTWPVSLDLWLDLQVRKVGALGEKRALVRQPRQQPVPGEGTATGEAGLSPRDKGRRSMAPQVWPHGFPTSRNFFLFLGESC